MAEGIDLEKLGRLVQLVRKRPMQDVFDDG
jgi:hypothetical protein